MYAHKKRIRFATALVVLGLGLVQPSLHVVVAQTPERISPRQLRALENAKRHVVLITAAVDRYGAGIVFGYDSSHVYVATAYHVIERNRLDTLALNFNFLGSKDTFDATWSVGKADSLLDLAVVQVDRRSERDPIDSLSFGLLGSLESLRSGDSVYGVGHPTGQFWFLNIGSPWGFAERDSLGLRFQTNEVRPGYSGGVLLDEFGGIVGMIKTTLDREAVAIDVDQVIGKLDEWQLPIALHPLEYPTRSFLRQPWLWGVLATGAVATAVAIIIRSPGPDPLPNPPSRPPSKQ